MFFADLPQPLLNPLPLGTMVIGDNDQVNAAFQDMSSQSMALFVWLLDLMTDILNLKDHNQSTIKSLGAYT
jgi:hypothetical protein